MAPRKSFIFFGFLVAAEEIESQFFILQCGLF